jgi:sialidase-1
MADIHSAESGILYKNPKPHVTSVHAYFPSVVYLGDEEYLATAVLGEAFEAANIRTHLFRSTDGGNSWRCEGLLYAAPSDRLRSDAARLTKTPEGDLVAFLMRHDRTDYPGEGLTNPETLGFVPTELLLSHSTDKGKSWSSPKPIVPPLAGPSFELCSPITVLRDGRWLLPTSTWPGWEGDCPNGIRMVAFESRDGGATWPSYSDVMREVEGTVYFWESKIVELSDGRLVATAWVHDADTGMDRPNHFALSENDGASWTAPQSTKLMGQTLTPHALDNGRILSVYRRMDTPGLWATVSRLDGNQWINEAEAPIWGARARGLTGASANMSKNFGVLRFGAPCLTRIKDNSFLLTFWCYEDCVSVIRWYRLQVS